MSTAPRRVRLQESRRHYVPITILAKTPTTFRYVIRQPTLSASSRLRRSLNPVPTSASGLCHRTPMNVGVLRQALRLFPRATRIDSADASSPLHKAMKRASGAVTLHAGGIPRTTLIGNDNGGCTRSEDPGPSHWLREERATSPPVPHAERREDAACSFTWPLSGSRRTPQDGTCTAPTLGAGWCRVNPTASGFHGVERRSTYLSLPQASPQALSAAATVTSRPASPRQAGPSNGVASGHLNVSAERRLLLLAQENAVSVLSHAP